MSDLPPELQAPVLADLDWDEYADLLTEVDGIDQDATEQTGH